MDTLVDGRERRHNRGRVKHSDPWHRDPLDRSPLSRRRRRAHSLGFGLRTVWLDGDAPKQGPR